MIKQQIKKHLLLIIAFNIRIIILAQPTGIYALDSNQGTYRDANIRNYSFVATHILKLIIQH
jgi:hypothetical protein